MLILILNLNLALIVICNSNLYLFNFKLIRANCKYETNCVRNKYLTHSNIRDKWTNVYLWICIDSNSSVIKNICFA
jgi:hypothetical protein